MTGASTWNDIEAVQGPNGGGCWGTAGLFGCAGLSRPAPQARPDGGS
jgi:hypothetical protein